MSTLMYGAGVSSPDVPWWPKRQQPVDPLAPAPATFTVAPDLGPLTQAVVALSARVELLAAEVKALKDAKPKRRRARR